MKTSLTKLPARPSGFVLGLGAALVLVLEGQMPPGEGTLGLDLRVSASPTAELAASPQGPLLTATRLVPRTSHSAAEGTAQLTNQTGRRLAVKLRAVPSSGDLDELLVLELWADGQPLRRARLGELRRFGRERFVLESGETQSLRVRASLPSSVERGYEGRIEDVQLDLETRPVPE